MEQNPIYQGTQYVAANTATSNANVPRKLLFAEEWERNRHATTQALQGIEQALVERNDNTVLLNQQAEAKRRDLEMTMEMKSILDLDNGVEGSWYDNNGKLNKQAVRDFIKKYSTMPTQWAKAAVSPEAQQKSASMSQAYQIGVREAVEAAILANTKKRELKAYQDNMQLAEKMKDYDSMTSINHEAGKRGLKSPQEVASDDIAIDGKRLASEIEGMQDVNVMMDSWNDPEFQQRLQYHSDLKEAFEKKIEDANSTQATTTGDHYVLDPKTGKMKAVAGKVTPPDNAPWYIQYLIRQHNGKIPADQAFAAIQKYLSDEITEDNTTANGLQQWNRAHEMAKTIGVNDEAFNKAYQLRSMQIGFGGFDPKTVIKSIEHSLWLDTTQADENLSPDLTEKQREAAKERIAASIRDSVLSEYNIWWTQNAQKKPSIRAQYSKLLEISRRKAAQQPTFNAIDQQIRRATSDYLQQERAVAREVGRTRDRKRKTDELTREFNEKNVMPKPWQISTDLSFAYQISSTDSGSLPDSKTTNIIYLPKDAKLPAKSANVAIKNGTRGFTVEFRNADVNAPTLSRKLLRSLGTPTRIPASISWDGVNLSYSDALSWLDEGLASPEEAEDVDNAATYDTNGLIAGDENAKATWAAPTGELPF